MPYSPTYSHNAETGTSSGAAIWIVGVADAASFEIICTGAPGATATVFVECNSGALDDSGTPPPLEWIDQSGGGLAVVIPAAGVLAFDKKIPASGKPAWRTRISVNVGCTITSYIPFLITNNGTWVHAGNPPAAMPGAH